jgi:hypothetical protein
MRARRSAFEVQGFGALTIARPGIRQGRRMDVF